MLVIGIVLSLLAVVHAFIPMLPIFSVLYGLGAALALLSLLNVTNVWAVRFLAIASTGAMFLYFFGFFRLVQHFHDNWVSRRYGVGGHWYVAFSVRDDCCFVSLQLSTERF